MAKAWLWLFLQFISVLLQTSWVSGANLPDSTCHFNERMSTRFTLSKDDLGSLEDDEIIVEVDATTKQQCQKLCKDCKGFALVSPIDNPSKQYDGCYHFFKVDLDDLIKQNKLKAFGSSSDSKSEDIYTLFDRCCGGEAKIGGGNGAGGLRAMAAKGLWMVVALTTTVLMPVYSF